jgi:phage-related minor tail protein
MADETYGIDVNYNFTNIGNGIQSLNQLDQLLTKIAADSQSSSQAIQSSMAQVTASVNSTSNSFQQLASQIQAAGGSAGSGLVNVSNGAGQATKALGGLHVGTAGVTRELIVMGREAASGNWTRMASSFTLLAQRSGALSLIMNPLGLGILAVGAAAAGMAILVEQGAAQMRTFNTAMAATNGYAGLTTSSFRNMAQAISQSTGTGLNTSIDNLNKIVATGEFTGKSLQLVAEDSTELGKATGQSTSQMITYFGQMKNGVADFAAQYEQQYHGITEAQYEHVRALEESGQKEQAEQALLQAIDNNLATSGVQKLDQYKSAWDRIANAIGGAVDAVRNFGRQDSPAQELAGLQAERAARLRGQANTSIGNDGSVIDQPTRTDTSDLDARIAGLKKQIAAEDAEAAAKQKAAKINSDAVAAERDLATQYDNSRSSGEKLAKAVADINRERAQAIAGINADKSLSSGQKASQIGTVNTQANADIAEANRKDAPPKTPQKSQLPQFQEQLQQMLAAQQNWFSDVNQLEVKFWSDRLAQTTKGSSDYIAVSTKLNEALKAQAKEQYDDLIASDQAQVDATKAGSQARVEAVFLEFNDVAAYYQSNTKEYIAAQEKLTAATKEYSAQQTQIAIEAIKQQEAASLSSASTGGQIGQIQIQMEQAANAQKVKLNQMSAIQEAQANAQLVAQEIEQTQEAADKEYQIKLEALNKEIALQNAQGKNVDELNQQVSTLSQEYTNKNQVLYQQGLQKQQTATQTTTNAINDQLNSTATFFTNMFKNPQQALNSFFTSFLTQIAEAIAKATILQALFPGMNLGNGSGGLGSINVGSILGSAISGARAGGGDVAGGSAYLVGEKGPEIFAPGRSGTIIPNNVLNGASGGSGSSNVFQLATTINVANTNGQMDEHTLALHTAQQNQRMINNMIDQKLSQRGVKTNR